MDNTVLKYAILVMIPLLIVFLIILVRNNRLISGLTLQAFSDEGETEPDEVLKEFRRYQYKRFSDQQYWSWRLLWAAIGISLLLGSIIIFKKFIMNDADPEWLVAIIGLAGGSGVSLTAFRLYRIATAKVEQFKDR